MQELTLEIPQKVFHKNSRCPWPRGPSTWRQQPSGSLPTAWDQNFEDHHATFHQPGIFCASKGQRQVLWPPGSEEPTDSQRWEMNSFSSAREDSLHLTLQPSEIVSKKAAASPPGAASEAKAAPESCNSLKFSYNIHQHNVYIYTHTRERNILPVSPSVICQISYSMKCYSRTVKTHWPWTIVIASDIEWATQLLHVQLAAVEQGL